jgi:hypothetical protein
MRLPLRTLRLSGSPTMIEEHWLERAVEDRLGEVIDKYKAEGKDVHSVAGLRKRVRSDVEAMRGTAEWAKLRAKYEERRHNRLAWCCVCDRPVTAGSVTVWIEDKVGNVFCSEDCRLNTDRHPITFKEWKARVKAKGQSTTRRKEIVGGEVVEGEEFTITYEQIKDIGDPLVEELVPYDTSVDWTSDDS